jgi:hypothetical protein
LLAVATGGDAVAVKVAAGGATTGCTGGELGARVTVEGCGSADGMSGAAAEGAPPGGSVWRVTTKANTPPPRARTPRTTPITAPIPTRERGTPAAVMVTLAFETLRAETVAPIGADTPETPDCNSTGRA